MEAGRRFLIILSGKAGQGRYNTTELCEQIDQSFHQAGLSDHYDILITQHEGHLSEAARLFAEEYGATGVVYVAGGDGSLSEVAQSVHGSDCAFGVIPAGTANDFAKTIYGRKRPSLLDIVKAMPYPELERLDLMRLVFPPEVSFFSQYSDEEKLIEHHPPVNTQDGMVSTYSLNVVSFGLDTLILRRAYELMKSRPKLGGNAYYVSILQNLNSRKIFPTKFTLHAANGETISGEKDYVTVALCNGGYYGNGFNPAPMADPYDGVLNLCSATWMGNLRFVPILLRYLKGKHVNSHFINFKDVLAGEFSTADGEEILGNYDGLIFRTPSFSFQVIPQALPYARLKL